MERCLYLAAKGMGNVSPNPMVGSLVVHNGEIIGEGFPPEFGKEHAEVNAINSVKDKSLLPHSTIYVNLEPCAHFGKTPPCADLIVQSKIPHVVIGQQDPFSKVNGAGIQKLRDAGCTVEVGFCEKECLELNKRFFTLHEKKRPYVILKWAQSSDGFMDKVRGEGETGIHWISNPKTKRLVHQWRSEEDAILVGQQTVLNDNPSLTTREWPGKNPIRIVLGGEGVLLAESKVFDSSAPTLVYSKKNLEQTENIEVSEIDPRNLEKVLGDMAERGISSVIVEGGARIIGSFIAQNLWDEARIIEGESVLKAGLKAPLLEATIIKREKYFRDKISYYLPKD